VEDQLKEGYTRIPPARNWIPASWPQSPLSLL